MIFRDQPQNNNFLTTTNWINEDRLQCTGCRTNNSVFLLHLLCCSISNMFFFQLVIMSGTLLLAYYMECTDLFSVHVQGFFCNDADLMKPYPGTEESSFIPPLILYCVVAAAPTAIVSRSHLICISQHCLKLATMFCSTLVCKQQWCSINVLFRLTPSHPPCLSLRQQPFVHCLKLFFVFLWTRTKYLTLKSLLTPSSIII